jgi:hypothetical protein
VLTGCSGRLSDAGQGNRGGEAAHTGGCPAFYGSLWNIPAGCGIGAVIRVPGQRRRHLEMVAHLMGIATAICHVQVNLSLVELASGVAPTGSLLF